MKTLCEAPPEETLQYCSADLLPPTGAPGEKFSYSNTNYTLLGLIIEAVTGNDATLGKYTCKQFAVACDVLGSFSDRLLVIAVQRSGGVSSSRWGCATPSWQARTQIAVACDL